MPYVTKQKARLKTLRGRDGRFLTPTAAALQSFPIDNPVLQYGKSGISGVGVFATIDIPIRSRLCEYKGDVIDNAERERRERSYQSHHHYNYSTYVYKINNNLFIDATTTGNESRFVNHCCRPNCIVKLLGGNHIVYYATKAIPARTELTIDYQLAIGKANDVIVQCKCGETDCRGTL